MANVYNWIIPENGLVTKPKDGTLLDVVIKVNWRRKATFVDGDKTYTSDMCGVYDCPSPSGTDFTAYPDLTEADVCSWLDVGLDVTAINAQLDLYIEEQVNPPIVILPNPWSPAPVDTTAVAL
jgi:hypothetical protein